MNTIDFSDLLIKQGIEPKMVLVLRHTPTEPSLKRAFPYLASEEPELFNSYQQMHGKKVEDRITRLRGQGYVASFVGIEGRKAVFVGLYKILPNVQTVSRTKFWQIPEHIILRDRYGYMESKAPRPTALMFSLDRVSSFYGEWSGRLVIDWPAPSVAWCRNAHGSHFPICAIHEESVLVPRVPQPTELVLTWSDLSALPSSWQAALSQWRAIYYIDDASHKGPGYVGAAYGNQNVLGRWRNYASGKGDGGNKYLKGRDPKNFRFSILQLLSPDAEEEAVFAAERSWMRRIGTHHPRGLNSQEGRAKRNE